MDIETTTRRDFMKEMGMGAAALTVQGCARQEETKEEEISPAQTVIPRWRGFNFINFFYARKNATGDQRSREYSDMMTKEDDFRWMRDWGFDFIRLPMSYATWLDVDYQSGDSIKLDDVYKIRESTLEKIDRTVDQAQKYGIHLNLNFHRAPGFCVNEDLIEPFNLWTDQEARDAFIFHWDMIAKRYRSIPASQFSINLVNEPHFIREPIDTHDTLRENYIQLVRATTEKIKESNPDRMVIADGPFDFTFYDNGEHKLTGVSTLPELIGYDVIQSSHGYFPFYLTHYQTSYTYLKDAKVPPEWPGDNGGEYWDRSKLEENCKPWIDIARQGVGVHFGEFGCYIRTPHKVVLAFLHDFLDILTSNNIGWALWNLRGNFGILDSGRTDVEYEDWFGHKLDRKMLDLLLKF